MAAKSKTRRAGKKKQHRGLSRLRKPEDMSLEDWQIGLRREFAESQKFRLKNLGDEPLFSEFEVTNPETQADLSRGDPRPGAGRELLLLPRLRRQYAGHLQTHRVRPGQARRRPGAKTALALGHQPPYSEVYLQYGAEREVVFRPGTECPASLRAFARRFFDAQSRLKPEAFARFHDFLQKASSNGHEFRCYNDALGVHRPGARPGAPGRARRGGLSAGDPLARRSPSC